MKLLARNAECLFWLARYLERAASLARVIEMQSSHGEHDKANAWTWLLALYNEEERFKEHYETSFANIVSYYVTDAANSGSIRTSVGRARENARALRPFIPLEMWAQLNQFHTAVEAISENDIAPASLSRVCAEVRAGCLAQIGTAEGTLFRDEGHCFFRLGLMVERADQTSRLLDVKAAHAKSSGRQIDPADEFVFWATILRTASAYQAFRRLQPARIDQGSVARFLLLDTGHPRSIGFCVREISAELTILDNTFGLAQSRPASAAADDLMAGLKKEIGDADMESHLHALNDWIQRSIMLITERISEAMFRVEMTPPAPSATAMPSIAASETAAGAVTASKAVASKAGMSKDGADSQSQWQDGTAQGSSQASKPG